MTRILAISGSLRRGSHNTALLRAAAAYAPEGVDVELFEGLERIPPYNEDHDTDDVPTEVARLREEIGAADAVLFSTPEYNGTMPGQLKQVVDWASRPHGQASSLWGKPVAVIGASVTDYGAIWAQDHLRKALGIAGGRVLDAELVVPRAPEHFDADGELSDEEMREQLNDLVVKLVEHAHSSLTTA
jgi:chromate reductase, NAD(P)H dehydrogenase (quinone)